MTFVGRSAACRAGVLAAAAGAVLALAAGAQAGTRAYAAMHLQAGSICKITESSEWKKIDASVSKASDAVSKAMSGTGDMKEGQKGAKAIADALRKESKLVSKASGNAKARKALSEAYSKSADLYDAVAKILPDMASALKAAQKGDTKSLEKVMDVTAKVMQPASEALGKLSTTWSDLLKSC